jgi:hypothetical protein
MCHLLNVASLGPMLYIVGMLCQKCSKLPIRSTSRYENRQEHISPTLMEPNWSLMLLPEKEDQYSATLCLHSDMPYNQYAFSIFGLSVMGEVVWLRSHFLDQRNSGMQLP